MRVQGNRIGELESCKQILLARVHRRRSTVRAIYVQPEIKLTRNCSDLFKWINRAGVHGSGTGNNAEGS